MRPILLLLGALLTASPAHADAAAAATDAAALEGEASQHTPVSSPALHGSGLLALPLAAAPEAGRGASNGRRVAGRPDQASYLCLDAAARAVLLGRLDALPALAAARLGPASLRGTPPPPAI